MPVVLFGYLPKVQKNPQIKPLDSPSLPMVLPIRMDSWSVDLLKMGQE